MGRPCWCRHCEHPDQVIAGVFPATCQKCGESNCWATQPGTPPPARKHKKTPRVPFTLTENDYRLFLKRVKISAE